MRFKLATLILAASCLPAMAVPPAQGNVAVVTGLAHVEKAASGTYIHVDSPGAPFRVSGFIAFGDQGTYPGLDTIEGRRVAITGVLVWSGRAMIIMTDPSQLDIAS